VKEQTEEERPFFGNFKSFHTLMHTCILGKNSLVEKESKKNTGKQISLASQNFYGSLKTRQYNLSKCIEQSYTIAKARRCEEMER